MLKVQSVSKAFGGNKVLRELQFEVGIGERISIVGANGSGKTTLVNIITGFVLPDSGSVRLNGKNLAGMRPDQIWHQGVARTFQQGRLFLGLSAIDNIMLPCTAKAVPLDAARSLAVNLLREVGLTEREDQLAGTMSAGQRRRLELARAIAMKPALLLLDEVTSGIDFKSVPVLCDLILRLQDQFGFSLVVIEHNPKVVRRLADEVAFLAGGQIQAKLPPDDVFAQPEVISMYMGVSE